MRTFLVALSFLLSGLAHAESYKLVHPKKLIISTPAEHPEKAFAWNESRVPKLQALGLATIAREAELLKVEHGAKALSIHLKSIEMLPVADDKARAVIKAKVVFHYAADATR